MAEEFTTIEDVKGRFTESIIGSDQDNEIWGDITLTCSKLYDPLEVEFVPNSGVTQCGLFEDRNGDTIRFVSWDGSNPPMLKKGETYDLEDAFIVYGKGEDSYKVVFRSDTEAHAGASFVQTTQTDTTTTSDAGGTCPNCGESLSEENHHEGPGAPSVGWEYFTCPSCENNLRPEVV